MSADTFWHSDAWREYERICQVPVSRVEELAAATWQTRVIDLSVSEADLWRGVRKSYKSLIHAAELDHQIREGRTGVDVGIAKAIHELAAERETRPVESWGLMADWLAQDQAALWRIGVAAFVYVIRYGAWAYYASGASRQQDLNHALIWHAMLGLKARGVRWFEIGWQGQAVDEKGQNIEFFRRGFGGFDIPAQDAPLLCSGAQPIVRAAGSASGPASTILEAQRAAIDDITRACGIPPEYFR